MSRMCIVRNKDKTVSCLPVHESKLSYYLKYEVICFANKQWNPHFVGIIKKYFSK